MSHLPFYQEQLDFMVQLASHRTPFLDSFFRFLNFFDTPYFFFVLIPCLWLGFSYRWGLRLFYWMSFNNIVIVGLKNGFGWNRPSTDLPAIGLFHPKSFGFPSGAAQISLFLGGLLIYYGRFRYAKWIGFSYILLISFSRLYLGVHYPLDVFGGWLFGFLTLFLFIGSRKSLEAWLQKLGLLNSFFLSIGAPLLLLILFPQLHFVMSSTLGIGIGTHLSLQKNLFLPDATSLKQGVLRAVLGVFLLYAALFLLPRGQAPLTSFLAGLFMSLAASPICRRLVGRDL